MTRYLRFLTVVAAAAFLVGCGGSGGGSTGGSDASQSGGNSAPSATVESKTTVTTIYGKPITVEKIGGGIRVEGQEGKIVLLEVFGWTCPHCIAAIDGYNRIKAKYPNDVYILTVESYATTDEMGLQQFAAQHNISYDVVSRPNSGALLQYVQSLTGYTPEAYGVPALLVFDRNGQLVEYFPPQDLPEQQVIDLIEGLK